MLLIAAIALSYPTYWRERYWTQLHAIQRLRDLGVQVIDQPYNEKNQLQLFVGKEAYCRVQSITFRRQKVTREMMECVGEVFTLTSLEMDECVVNEDDFAAIKYLSDLDDLNFQQTNISDRSLRFFTPFAQLQSLALLDTQVSNDGLACLAEMKHLENLSLYGTDRITEDCLIHLRSLPSLNAVALEGFTFTDRSEISLKQMTQVRSFDLGGSIFDADKMHQWLGDRYR